MGATEINFCNRLHDKRKTLYFYQSENIPCRHLKLGDIMAYSPIVARLVLQQHNYDTPRNAAFKRPASDADTHPTIFFYARNHPW